jgi:hypothetical protein
VRRVAALVQPLEHAPLHRLPGHTQERTDERWSERLLSSLGVRKVT